MSYNFKILTSNQQEIGLLPSTALLQSHPDDMPSFGDIINSWVLFTKRTTTTDSPLGKLISIMPNIFERVIPLATSFSLAGDNSDMPNPDELEVVVMNGKDYYVLESDSLDYGLVECTLQEVSEFHDTWNAVDADDAIDVNSQLLAEFVLGTAFNNLANQQPLTVGRAAPAIVQPPKVTAVAAPATKQVSTPNTAQGTVKVSTNGSVTVDGNIQVAAGFLGLLPSTAAPEQVALNKLATFLNK